MLSTAKPLLEQQLLKILTDAYMTQYEPNKLLNASKYNTQIKADFQKKALKFAQQASGPVATAIYDFIKEIGITISIPPTIISPVTPITPGGPCSGVIPMTDIQIL